MVCNQLQEVTIDTMRRLKGMDRTYALLLRKKWLEEQRIEDINQLRRIKYRVDKLRNKINTLLQKRYIFRIDGYVIESKSYIDTDLGIIEVI